MVGPDPSPSHVERRAFALVWGVLAVLTLIPIWGVRYQPMPDLAVHIAAGSVLHHIHDPAFDFARYYELSLGLTPYWGYYGPLHLLSYLFPVETANRVILSLYALGLPLGAALLARRFDRSAWLSVFAFPVVWNFNFTIGFISFALGFAMVPFALVLFDRFCARPTILGGAATAALGTAIYMTHLLPWGMFIGGAGLIGLLARGLTVRALFARLAVWAVPVAAGLWVMRHGQGLNMGRVSQGITWKRYPTWQSVSEMYKWVWDGCTGREDEVLAALLLVGWVALKATAPRMRRSLHDYRAEACFAVAFAAYLILPRSILTPAYWWGVNIRFACMAFFFAALCVEGPITRWRLFLLAPAVIAAAGFSVDTTVHWVRAMRFAAGYDELAKLPEPGSRVLFILAQPWRDPTIRSEMNYVHTYYDLYQAQRGGYMPWNFDEAFPLKYKVRYPAPHFRSMHFEWDKHAPYYDYVFAFQAEAKQLFRGREGEVKLVGSSGKWRLFRLPGPRLDTPPGPTYPSDWAFDPNWRPPAKR